MIYEGRNAVNEALKGNITIEKVLAEKNYHPSLGKLIAEIRERKIKLSYVERSVLDKYSGGHQGIIAFVTDFKYSTEEDILRQGKEGSRLIIILDGLEDPHNLGSVIRIADAVAADGIILPRHRSCGVTDTVIKVSAGAAAHVKIAKVANINDSIRRLKDIGVTVLAADAKGGSLYQYNLKGDLALVIGGEGAGVHALTAKLADGVVSLPLLGKINSLNAAVASGAILYEVIRQRTGP